MIKAYHKEKLYIVTKLKNKISVAVAAAIIRLSKTQGISPVECARNLQNYCLQQNQEELDPEIVQRNLTFRQEEVVKTIKQFVPFKSPGGYQNSENGKTDSNWDFLKDDNLTEKERTSEFIDNAPYQNLSRRDDNVLKNAKFLESLLTLNEECELNSGVPSQLLHSLLLDKSDRSTQTLLSDKSFTRDDQFTDDSGLGNSEGYSEDNDSAKFVSSNVIKYSLHSSRTNELLTLSLKDVVSYFKNMLATECEDMFYEWKGSLSEHICNVIKKSSRINSECRELVVNLIVEVIGECWNDHRSFIHIYSEKKMLIVNELIGDLDVCYEVLQDLKEKFSIFNTYVLKKHVDIPILTEKLTLFLNLYCTTCETARELQSKNINNKPKSEEIDVSVIWMNNYCNKDIDSTDSAPAIIDDNDILVLERLLISLSRYPYISMVLIEALNLAKSLKNGRISVQEFSDNLCSQ